MKLKRTTLLVLATISLGLVSCGNELPSSNSTNSNPISDTSSTEGNGAGSATSTSSATSTGSSTSTGGTTVADSEIITIADFVAAQDETNYKYLKGVVTKITNTKYVDFYLKDATGTIYVYGLFTEKGGSTRVSDLAVGDEIVIGGLYKYFSGDSNVEAGAEVSKAYLVEKVSTGNDVGSDVETGDHTFTDFTASEKQDLQTYFGFVIPFIANDEYYIDDYFEDYQLVNFYTFGNTSSEFNSYLNLFKQAYSNDGTEVDDEGDTWYLFSHDDVYIDVAYYLYDTDYVVDVYVYYDDGTSGDSGSEEVEGTLLTNEGKGLPTGTDGVYDVDFTKGNYVKDVTDQYSYVDGCPTTGDVNVLVVPVEFSDVTAASKGYSIDNINKAFNGGEDANLAYTSVKDYFATSSYNQLNLTFDVYDSWLKPSQASTAYLAMDEDTNPDQMIMDELLQQLEPVVDLTKYDSDDNGTIDAIVLVNTLDIDTSDDGNLLQWAYRYWNMYSEDGQYLNEYDNVAAWDYLWASYQFLFEEVDEDGYTTFDGTTANNPFTFIHEFSHVLGADDYYDTSYNDENIALDGHDMMDSERGDHNPYTKFNYGWVTKSKLVTAESSVTLDLNAFETAGDTIIVANNWDDTLGAYQEYWVVMYYTNTSLNAGAGNGYFDEEGIVMYHVNASLLEYQDYYGETVYDVYNSNTSLGQYGTEDNLIELVANADSYVFGVGDTLSSTVKDDSDTKIAYTFTVNSIADGKANLTFTKNN